MTQHRASLLKIDVALEIRKLTQNRFKSSTEWAVSLCRHLISCDATRVEIRITRGHLSIRAKGTQIEIEALRRLSIVFDVSHALDARHQAIVSMESSKSFELLCAFYLKNAVVKISSGAVDLQVTRSRHALLNIRDPRDLPTTTPALTSIEVSCAKIDASALASVVGNACRHAAVPVYLNGSLVSEGLVLPDCFIQQPFELGDIRGVVGIPLKSDFVRQIVLRHGVVVKDSLKQPAFGLLYHAVVDSRHDIEDLRQLRTVVRNLYLKLGAAVENLRAEQKQRAVEVLFDRFLETKDRNYIVGVRAFETVNGRRLSLEEVHQLASRGPIYAIPPASTAPWLHSGRLVLVLDAKQWNFLEKDLEAVITAPPIKVAEKPAFPARGLRPQPSSSQPSGPFSAEVRLAADHILRNMG
jgi:hypothetical protein